MSPFFEYTAIVQAENRHEADSLLDIYVIGLAYGCDGWDTFGEVRQVESHKAYKDERKLTMVYDRDGNMEPVYDPIPMFLISDKGVGADE